MSNLLVVCPALGNAVDVDETCEQCRFLVAIAEMSSDERIKWTERHNLVCNYPRRLQLMTVEKTDDAIETIESRSVSKAVKRG